MMGTATASGPDRAREAAEKAIACPLLEGANLQGARGLLVYVTASAETMTNPEIREVMSVMKNFVSRDANQIIGTAFDNDMGDELPQFAPQTNDPALQQPQTVHQPAPQPQQHLSDDWARTAPQDKPQQSEVSATPFVSVPTFIRHR